MLARGTSPSTAVHPSRSRICLQHTTARNANKIKRNRKFPHNMSLHASCPGCSKVFRPRTVVESACWDSVTTHISELSRRNCYTHKEIHSALYRRPFGCPGCPEIFSSKIEALQHLTCATDDNHSRFKLRQEDGGSSTAQRRERPANPAPTRSTSELYSAAKSGYVETVRMLLSSGLNPDQGGEDGFTPLMTAAEAGHAQVITLLTQHPLCKINRKNRYGQVCSPPLS